MKHQSAGRLHAYGIHGESENPVLAVKVEPSEEMVGMIRQYIPRGVFQEN